MEINEKLFRENELISFELRELYASFGYRPYRMSKFEEYNLYAENREFLVSDNVITFTDEGGKLMALKPDVTLSIIKNSKDLPGEIQKVFYSENVYRAAKGTNSFRELMQTGVECFGAIDSGSLLEVITLAAKSLEMLSGEYYLSVSNVDILELAVESTGFSPEKKKLLYKALAEKNVQEIDGLCGEKTPETELLRGLAGLSCPVTEANRILAGIVPGYGADPRFADFRRVIAGLAISGFADRIRLDFSVVCDINYYSGIVFKGNIRGIPEDVLSGGRYDKLMHKMHRNSGAVGFAVYTDSLERLERIQKETGADEFINVALPKGRLGEKAYAMLAEAGYECPAVLENSRKLIFENTEKKVRYFWVKPSDVAIYVERGAADLGICGKDILQEYEPHIYELCDLGMGKCRMAVAGPKGFCYDNSKTLRVATKFVRIATEYYRKRGIPIDIVKLNGSIEIAPILGLSDVIVDIVETGATLRENDLEAVEEVLPISARLIANRSSFRFKESKVRAIAESMKKLTEERK